MSERTSYAAGTPCWIELSGTPDIEASAAFYREVFGWETPEMPNSAELGGYRRAKLNGKDLAGVSPKMDDSQPIVWATYVSVEDAAATIVKVGEAGGQTIAEPMDVMGMGTMAVFSDPTGAVCGIWQPGTFPGAAVVNEYGSWGWNELSTRDPGAAKEFYGAVFDWGFDDEESDRAGTYTVWKVGETMVGGMLDMNAVGMPAEVPPHWLVYFTVEDTDAAVERIKSAGGNIMMEPIDIPVGRFAVGVDQFGAAFAVMQPTAEALAETL